MTALIVITAILVVPFAWFRVVIYIGRRQQRIAMIKRYLINLYFHGLPEEEFNWVTCLPEHQKATECARMENEAFSIVQKIGMPSAERLAFAYYERLRKIGELRRDLPAYEEYFKYIDMGGKL